VALALYALVDSVHTVSMQPVSTSSTSAGALRQAHSLVTSSQPLGSARPMGMRQFQTQAGWAITLGSAVMVYGAVETLGAIGVGAVIETMLLMDMDMVVVLDWAIVRAVRAERVRDFILRDSKRM